MILQAEKHKVVNIFLNKLCALLIFYWTSAELVFRIEDTLGHENFNDIEEGWITIQVELNLIQNHRFLGHEFILFTIKAHILAALTTLQGRKAAFVHHLITLLLRLCWLITG